MIIWLTLSAVASFVSATPLNRFSPASHPDFVKKHVHAQVPQGWEMLNVPLEDHHTISLQIGLKQANFDGLVKELYEVSDPAHPNYGKHLSQAWVIIHIRSNCTHAALTGANILGKYTVMHNCDLCVFNFSIDRLLYFLSLEFVKPHPDAISAVDEWLAQHRIDVSNAVSRSAALDWVRVTVPISVAERLVDTKYNVFRNKVIRLFFDGPSMRFTQLFHRQLERI